MVDFYTDPYCLKCTNQTKLHKLCPRCRKELEYEIPKWQEISQIIHDHKCHNENELNTFMAQQFHFPNWQPDWELILKQDKKFGKLSFFRKNVSDKESESPSDSSEEEKDIQE